ncbi:hypothetical protein J4G07_11220 [Candidatus Poribacteria bacterium]|nr:hypothetical protein [Candidatus Poribacteria bacterium]
MKLQEEHKEFVVKGYACFMKPSEILNNFMIAFASHIAEAFLEGRAVELEKEAVEEILRKKDHFTEVHYLKDHEPNIYQFDLYKTITTKKGIQQRRQVFVNWKMIIAQINRYNKILRGKCENNFRRLNITHPQFPQKYRTLFNETREQYLASYRTASLSLPENLILELEFLYGLTKELVIEKRDLKYITQASQILKTIAACNAVNQQEQPLDITPQDVNALQDTQKTLTDQLKKETRQLRKHTENTDA